KKKKKKKKKKSVRSFIDTKTTKSAHGATYSQQASLLASSDNEKKFDVNDAPQLHSNATKMETTQSVSPDSDDFEPLAILASEGGYDKMATITGDDEDEEEDEDRQASPTPMSDYHGGNGSTKDLKKNEGSLRNLGNQKNDGSLRNLNQRNDGSLRNLGNQKNGKPNAADTPPVEEKKEEVVYSRIATIMTKPPPSANTLPVQSESTLRLKPLDSDDAPPLAVIPRQTGRTSAAMEEKKNLLSAALQKKYIKPKPAPSADTSAPELVTQSPKVSSKSKKKRRKRKKKKQKIDSQPPEFARLDHADSLCYVFKCFFIFLFCCIFSFLHIFGSNKNTVKQRQQVTQNMREIAGSVVGVIPPPPPIEMSVPPTGVWVPGTTPAPPKIGPPKTAPPLTNIPAPPANIPGPPPTNMPGPPPPKTIQPSSSTPSLPPPVSSKISPAPPSRPNTVGPLPPPDDDDDDDDEGDNDDNNDDNTTNNNTAPGKPTSNNTAPSKPTSSPLPPPPPSRIVKEESKPITS
ncbi:hypothetical protein RFI_12880, partial [Reticulomyxa filosa]